MWRCSLECLSFPVLPRIWYILDIPCAWFTEAQQAFQPLPFCKRLHVFHLLLSTVDNLRKASSGVSAREGIDTQALRVRAGDWRSILLLWKAFELRGASLLFVVYRCKPDRRPCVGSKTVSNGFTHRWRQQGGTTSSPHIYLFVGVKERSMHGRQHWCILFSLNADTRDKFCYSWVNSSRDFSPGLISCSVTREIHFFVFVLVV